MLKPLSDRLVVRRDTAEDKTEGGIVLPDTAKQKPHRGKVLATGPGRMLDSGVRSPMQVRKGDVAVFTAWAGSEIPDPENPRETLTILNEADVLGVME